MSTWPLWGLALTSMVCLALSVALRLWVNALRIDRLDPFGMEIFHAYGQFVFGRTRERIALRGSTILLFGATVLAIVSVERMLR